MILTGGEVGVSRKPLVKMSLGSSEKGLMRLSDEEWWNRRSSSEVRAMLIGANDPRHSEGPDKRERTLTEELNSRAEGQGESEEWAGVVERVDVESDASWGKEGGDWQSHTYAVTHFDRGSSVKTVVRNVRSSSTPSWLEGSSEESE